MQTTWSIDLAFTEDEKETRAVVAVALRGERFTGEGSARRNPDDPNVPVVGEELATARALSDLSHKLLDGAAKRIEEFEGRPVSLPR